MANLPDPKPSAQWRRFFLLDLVAVSSVRMFMWMLRWFSGLESQLPGIGPGRTGAQLGLRRFGEARVGLKT